MSLESSQEQTEQEWPRSGTAAEIEQSSTVETDSGEKQLPGNVPPAPVLLNPEELVALLLSWIRTPDWSSSQTYLQAHPELLTEAAAQVLAALTQQRPDQQVRELLLLHRQLLQGASQQGIEAAYQALVQPAEPNAGAATASEDLLAQVMAWLQTPDWQTSQTYLQRHPQLLSEAADQVLEVLKRSQSEQQAQAILNLHLALLHQARVEGIEAAYERVLVPEPETLPSEQDVTTSQALQDLNDAGVAALHQYRVGGRVADLNRAVEWWHQALELTPSNSPDRPIYLNNLGIALRSRYSRTGELADLEVAISAYQQALELTPSNSPDRPRYLNNLGIGLRSRYARTGELADLQGVISAFQQAIQASPSDSPDRPALLNNLGNGLRSRYSRTGNLADLEAAISAYQQAVQATPSNSLDRPGRLNNLGAGLHDRYDRAGNLTDLQAAISAYQQAVEATPPDSPDRPRHLSNLGNGLRSRYDRTGELADLEAAISAFQQAVRATPFNSPDRATLLNNLGIGLRSRYARTGELADLEAAITVYQQAVQATPFNSPDRPRYLNNLGIGLRIRYQRTGELADLEAANSAFQQAVQATPFNSPDRPARLNNLGNGLHNHYSRTGELADLEAANSAFQQAIQTSPSDSPDRPALLNNLGIGLHERYKRTGELADLQGVISAFQRAIQTSPSDSPDRPALLSNLGLGLRNLYSRTGNLADLEAAIAAWEEGWSIPNLRFSTLPLTYQLGQQRQGAGLAAQLVTAYLEQAKQRHPRSSRVPRRVLEIAEGSKSRLLTQLVGRGPLPRPVGLSAEIAAREQDLLAELTTLDTQELASHDHVASPQEDTGHLARLQQRQAILGELEELWSRIARLGPEGAAYVALRRGAAPTWPELAHLAQALGPATVLLSCFTTPDQALLFLLRAEWRTPRVVAIPLSQSGWANLLERFFREIHRYAPGLRRQETWDQPLLPLLAQAQRQLEGVERLLLAPAGNGHLLPWSVLAERADWHSPTGQPLPLVSLPALGVLPRLRQRPPVSAGPALVVGNPRGDLPHAEAEARQVAEHFGTTPLLGTAATKSAVLARLPHASHIHLATHAFFDPATPLESGIVLADGVLTAREVLQYRLRADVLVLSACDSGRVGSLGGEELAGFSQAFLQAGVRSLLVSLWRVNDPATAALMQAFYTARQTGADKALALRQAMTEIQQDPRWSHPYYWGAFVLVGDWE
jgi:hypothetical protein